MMNLIFGKVERGSFLGVNLLQVLILSGVESSSVLFRPYRVIIRKLLHKFGPRGSIEAGFRHEEEIDA